MKSNYKRIGEHISLKQRIAGLNISKQFIPSVTNIIGTGMENYKIIRQNQFACSTMQVRRNKKCLLLYCKKWTNPLSQLIAICNIDLQMKWICNPST